MKYKLFEALEHLVVSALTLLLIGLLVVLTVNIEFLNPVVQAMDSFSLADIYYRIQHTGQPGENQQITLVDMTDLSSRDRDRIAQVVEDISSLQPTALGVDIIFEGRKDADADDLLTDAFFQAPENTVLAMKLTDPDPTTHLFTHAVHSFFAADTHQVEGTVNVVNNPHRSMTTYPCWFMVGTDTLRSLPVLLAGMLGATLPGHQEEQAINYRGTTFPVVHWTELQQKRHLIENRIVLLGSTHEEADKHQTPLGQRPGMEIVAYTLLSILEGVHISSAPYWLCLLTALLLGAVANWVAYHLERAAGHHHMRSSAGRVRRILSVLLRFSMRSDFYEKLIAFVIIAVFTFFTYALFVGCSYFINTVLALSTVALVKEGRLIYLGLLAMLKEQLGWRGTEHSIYASELE